MQRLVEIHRDEKRSPTLIAEDEQIMRSLGVCREYVSTSLTLRWRYVEQHQNRERETGVTSWVAFLRPQGPFSQPMHGFSLLIP
jgi:hypothetical protein